MKALKVLYSIVFVMLVGGATCYAQQTDSVKRKSVNYYSRFLKTDTATARQVSDVQDRYKKGLRQVIDNGLLTEQQKRLMIDSLVNEKNRRLEELLPADQRNLMIPATERKRTWKRDTTAKTNR